MLRLLRMFIKSKIVEDGVTAHDLTKIDVQKKENQIMFALKMLKIILKIFVYS